MPNLVSLWRWLYEGGWIRLDM